MGVIKGAKEFVLFKSGKKLTRSQAMKAKCYDCNGGEESREDCAVESCPMFQYRLHPEKALSNHTSTVGRALGKALTVLLVIFLYSSAFAYKVSPHFDYKEYSCKCCGETRINMELILALEELRIMVNKPIIINSGYRCPKHNKEVGGVVNSQHTQGNAVDIRLISGISPYQLGNLAKKCGFTYVKYYANFIHIDVRNI